MDPSGPRSRQARQERTARCSRPRARLDDCQPAQRQLGRLGTRKERRRPFERLARGDLATEQLLPLPSGEQPRKVHDDSVAEVCRNLLQLGERLLLPPLQTHHASQPHTGLVEGRVVLQRLREEPLGLTQVQAGAFDMERFPVAQPRRFDHGLHLWRGEHFVQTAAREEHERVARERAESAREMDEPISVVVPSRRGAPPPRGTTALRSGGEREKAAACRAARGRTRDASQDCRRRPCLPSLDSTTPRSASKIGDVARMGTSNEISRCSSAPSISTRAGSGLRRSWSSVHGQDPRRTIGRPRGQVRRPLQACGARPRAATGP